MQKQHSARGSALTQVLVATMVVTSIMAAVVHQTEVAQKDANNRERHSKRATIANRLAEQLTNPDFVQASATPEMAMINPGNKALRNCLGLDALTSPLDPNGPKGCDPRVESSFLLAPPVNYAYPVTGMAFQADARHAPRGPTTVRPHAATNCPDPNPSLGVGIRLISCFLAGERGDRKVAYNYEGDLGPPGKDFPFLARVFFRPACVDNVNLVTGADGNVTPVGEGPNGNDPCQIATAFYFRYELTQMIDGRKGPMGTYPIKKGWIRVPRTMLIGQMCNPGGKVFVLDQAGHVECRCQHPWQQKGNQSNAQGPICELMVGQCPPGLVSAGVNPDGNPLCEYVNFDTVKFGGVRSVQSSEGTIVKCVDEAAGGIFGWVNKINTTCSSFLSFKPQDNIGLEIWKIIAGGLMAAAIAYIIFAMIFPVGGLPVLIAMMSSFIIAGSLLAYIFWAQITSWEMADQAAAIKGTKNSNYPEIKCTTQIECARFVPKNLGP